MLFKSQLKIATVWLLFFLTTGFCHGQTGELKKRIDAITTLVNRESDHKSLAPDSTVFLIHAGKGVMVNQHDLLKDFGEGWMIVRADHAAELTQNHAARPVNYLWKVSDRLLRQTTRSVEHVVRSGDEALLSERCRLARLNQPRKVSQGVFIVKGSSEDIIDALATLGSVVYIGSESLTAQEESKVLDLNLNPNAINVVRHNFPDLDGNGITVSVKERQFDPNDIDLRGRNKPSLTASADSSSHATDMATTIAGAGNSFVTGRGAADHAFVTSSSFENLFPEDESNFTALDVSIQNHSYGTVIENEYGALAAAYDRSANSNTTLLHIFSSGNVGNESSTTGRYAGIANYANITGNAKMSKNTLTVGAVDTTGQVMSLSSRGPAYDGRIKPELVAYSTAGTSNSAALVSGVSTLLQQEYKNQRSQLPPSALIKSALITSAADVGPRQVDYVTGFGNVDAYRAVRIIKDGSYYEGSVSNGGVASIPLSIPANALNLKVTLVWNDPAAAEGSAKALVNDLDLIITNNDAPVHPWILNAGGTVESLSMPAVRGEDHLNNVEQVTIESSLANVTIEVHGTHIVSAEQSFSLTWRWDEAEKFEWYFPTGSDNFPYNGETDTYFYWRSTLSAKTGSLEVSTDDGQSWKALDGHVDLSKGYFRWSQLPAENTTALARMTVAGSEFRTSEFTISKPVSVGYGFNCGDSVMLSWSRQPEANQYKIFSLKGEYLEEAKVTTDTTWIFTRSSDAEYFSIQPYFPSGKQMLRSPAVSYEVFGVGCFVLSFVDEVIPEEGIRVHLVLSTTYGISKVVIEHEGAEGFESIFEGAPSDLNVSFLHHEPMQGLNRYRARILFDNGQSLTTEIIEDYFLTKLPFILFPNPVGAWGELQIFSKTFDVQDFKLRMFNTRGEIVRTQQLLSDREVLSLNGISPGLYVIAIETKEGVFRGKVIVAGD